MQLFPNMYRGMLACLMNTARQQGLRGLYAGIVPALASNCAENAVMFGTYGQCQRLVAGCVNGDVTRLNSSQNAVAGGVASVSVRTRGHLGAGSSRLAERRRQRFSLFIRWKIRKKVESCSVCEFRVRSFGANRPPPKFNIVSDGNLRVRKRFPYGTLSAIHLGL